MNQESDSVMIMQVLKPEFRFPMCQGGNYELVIQHFCLTAHITLG
jgi:hypothetical protein